MDSVLSFLSATVPAIAFLASGIILTALLIVPKSRTQGMYVAAAFWAFLHINFMLMDIRNALAALPH